jgi:DNA-binding transcriptional regulator GbsR (MarR family)
MELTDAEKGFIEEVGIVFEQTGLPRMSGRMFGWLLISDPPYQSASELAEVLMASKGSISTTIRLLVQMGIVERFIIPGQRHDHFRLKKDALLMIIRHGLEDEVNMFRNLAERGLKLMKKEPPARKQWLEEMYNRYVFLEKALTNSMKEYNGK